MEVFPIIGSKSHNSYVLHGGKICGLENVFRLTAS
jgi:antitoxin component HigA of HigAB toxin-antitoxin module